MNAHTHARTHTDSHTHTPVTNQGNESDEKCCKKPPQVSYSSLSRTMQQLVLLPNSCFCFAGMCWALWVKYCKLLVNVNPGDHSVVYVCMHKCLWMCTWVCMCICTVCVCTCTHAYVQVGVSVPLLAIQMVGFQSNKHTVDLKCLFLNEINTPLT